ATVAGGVAGADFFKLGGFTGGGFVGGVRQSLKVDGDAQDIDAAGVVFGLYGSRKVGAVTVDLSLIGGVSDFDSRRRVRAPGGVVEAEADFVGGFIAPEASFSTEFALNERVTLRPVATIGYAGLFFSGFDESGSPDDLSVDGRTAHIVRGRAELQADIVARRGANGGVLTLTPRIGLDGFAAFGGDVDATLVGTPIALDGSQGAGRATGFAGVRAEYRAPGGMRLFADMEGGFNSDGGRRLGGRIGIRIPLN
ncbi:MAG: autotransporter outer membrane beta-barrel domain-containing protein, partial [Pseudomonadota bacterium]